MKKLPVVLFALGFLASFSWAMEQKPDPKIVELKKRCETLSEETGEPHYYGEGRIVFLADYVLPTHSEQNPLYKNHKSYIAKIDAFPFERTYIKAAHAQWKMLPPIQKGQRYVFCYTIEREKYAIINHPETMLQLEE